MRARDLAEPFPSVTTDDPAIAAARLLAERSLPALLVLDADGCPDSVVPGPALIRRLLPTHLTEVPSLAGAFGTRLDAELAEDLAGLTVADWVPRHRYPPPVIGPDARPLEVATLMASFRSPLVAVVEREGDAVALLGGITVPRLLRHFLGARS
ncbi:CBS domain-containing protein [Streptomyces radicis]|uniref:CBS domain-containing protein n=1 Tax=Streptomyces radicis TaxID=1750517 RepID=A0A3A9WA85_9ACTN|nr:CBS domain-containing protein [Streptomyces radicis]RKN15474.1 CBS domain-containing protein [Streptomyces radicis]